MHVLILGAAGMVGRKLSERLSASPVLGGEPITLMTLFDVVTPARPATSVEVKVSSGDITIPGQVERLMIGQPDVVFHLAAIVSGEAEADLEKGYGVNLDATRALFDAIRRIGGGYRPRVVFASSIAVFGAPFPAEGIEDEFNLTPLTSYGTQKAIGELLLADYSRRGFFDGVGIRLPTIAVRPGLPNKAASGFFSGIIREPLNGQEAILPVPDTVRHSHASPRAAVDFLVHAATLDTARLGARRSLAMPSLSVTVAEQIDALRRVAGDRTASLIRREPDETITRIVSGWAERVNARRALDLGFRSETTFDEIIQVYIEDELGGQLVAA